MWIKYPVIIILFYLFALLQNSFFAHFELWGAVPNLVFIFFVFLIFFSAKGGQALIWEEIFYAVIAGFLLDVFYSLHIGISIILLIAIGFLIKKLQFILSERPGKYPFAYFLSIFIGSFAVYKLAMGLYFYFFGLASPLTHLGRSFLAGLAYNLFFSSVVFWVYKKFFVNRFDNKQLNLFNK